MAIEDARLLELAGGVADGDPADWPDTPEDSDSAVISDLRIIAGIARVHRERLAPASGDATASIPARPAPESPPPQQWAHLRIVERLGSGAYGDVYRAWDTNLEREVALKLLRRVRSTPSESVLHEGQRLARVSHPNVVTVYGAQQTDGRVGIWGELLHGRTLAEIVERDGPLSAKEACLCGEAISGALSAAHRQGVLHRDVKAQNVMREKGGRIVLMDFGLGLEVDDAAHAARLAGTPLYLAPELFTGAHASVQSDIYSLGVLLFYLVTGTMPVTGRSLDEIKAGHARGERQRLQDLRGDLPASFVRLVERALAANPAERFASSGELQAALAMAGDGFVTATDLKPRSRIGAIALVAATAVAVAGAFAMFNLWTRPVAPTALVAAIEAPPGARFTESLRNVAAISPDGRHVAFIATRNGASRLWIRSLSSTDAQMITDSIGAGSPFWSSDSRTIAFFSEQGLRQVSLGGVRSETLALTSEERGGAWSSSGVILFAHGPRDGLYTIPLGGGTPRPFLRPDGAREEIGFLWPQFLADGQRFVFFVWSNNERVRGIYLGRLGSSERTRLVGTDTSAVVAGGYLLFVRDGTLVAQQFDSNRAVVVGPAQPIATGVAATPNFRSAVTASNTGTLLYTPFQAADLTQPTWFNRSGKRLEAVGAAGKFRNPAISADGRYLVTQQYRDSISTLLLFDLTRGAQSRVPHRANAEFPVWSTDGRLAFAASDLGWLDIFVTRVDADAPAQPLFKSEADKMPTDWSPDGRFLSFTSLNIGGNYDLQVLPVDPIGLPIVIAGGPDEEADGHFSPDGRQLAYVSTAGGRPEVHVRAFPSTRVVRQVSTAGGLGPAWGADGTLYYLDLASRIMSVRVPADERAAIPAPVLVMQTDVITAGTSRNHFALTPDASRILINTPASRDRSASLTIVGNWTSLVPKS